LWSTVTQAKTTYSPKQNKTTKSHETLKYNYSKKGYSSKWQKPSVQTSIPPPKK
jgi:hypothetical protein